MIWQTLLAGLSVVASASDATVSTSLGPLVGTAPSRATCGAFYGVPYAAPPTGANRFRTPQPHAPWQRPRLAKHVGRSCLQGFGDGFVPLGPRVERLLEITHFGMEPMDEDCLYLNVFSPDLSSDRRLPVMVWFHGGSYLGGSGDKQSGLPFYDGHILCREGEVVVVTMNYRLGVFGFYASEELLAEQGTAGNMGIQDQRKALEWVQENAHLFGGAADRVTIFGESAGAGSVALHAVSPHSTSLFSAAIMESGGLWSTELQEAESRGDAVAAATKCSDLACLRDVAALDLLHAQLQVDFTASPVSDGYEWPVGVSLRDVVAARNFSAKPMLIGTNRNESALFDCLSMPQLNESSFRAALAYRLRREGPVTDSEFDRLVELYDGSKYDDGHEGTWPWKRALIDVDTDLSMFCDSRFLLDTVHAQQQATFAYILDQTMWFFEGARCLGTPHMTDLFFLWQNFAPVMTREERALGARMAKYWSGFAWNHTPGVSWPAFGEERGYLRLRSPEDLPDAQVKKEQCDIFQTIRTRSHHTIMVV